MSKNLGVRKPCLRLDVNIFIITMIEKDIQYQYKPWHHSPMHIFIPNSCYIVTASIHNKIPFFKDDERLNLLQNTLFQTAESYDWKLQAWALFPNHYHFIIHACSKSKTVKSLIQRIHSQTAREVNILDGIKDRQVWFQYWDTCITYEKSYYPRLNYVHNNPVKHGVVAVAENYHFCSAMWFSLYAELGYRRKVESFGFSRVKIIDDF